MISTRVVKMSISFRLKNLAYLLVDDLLGDGIYFVVAQVYFGEGIGFPEILDEFELVEVADLHWERCETLALHDKIARLLSALQTRLNCFLARWSRWHICLSCSSVLVCLGAKFNIWVALRGCYHDISTASKVITSRILEESRVCLAFSHFVFDVLSVSRVCEIFCF